MKNWQIVFAGVSSIETGGTVEAAAAPAEEGASRVHRHGGKGQGGSRPRVYKAVLWDAGWFQVRFVFNPITSVSALFSCCYAKLFRFVFQWAPVEGERNFGGASRKEAWDFQGPHSQNGHCCIGYSCTRNGNKTSVTAPSLALGTLHVMTSIWRKVQHLTCLEILITKTGL